MLMSATAGATAMWAAIALQAATLQADAASDVDAQARAVFDGVAQAYPSLNATVMIGDAIVWEAEGGNAPRPEDGVSEAYNVYSTAKLFTGLAYARLQQAGQIDLDMPVRMIDPALPDHYAGVTLRQLLDHTAGVRHYTSDNDWIAFSDRRCRLPADALGHFIDDPLVTAPGEAFAYSTYGYVLLSHLLIGITGAADFDAAMRAVLGEAYLAHADSEGTDKAVNWLGGVGDWQEYEDLSAECKFGGGGLVASSRDLAAMGAALYQGEVIDPDGLADLAHYWIGRAEEVDLTYAAHSGGSPGGRSLVLVYIEPQVSVGLTGNFDGENLQGLAIALADLFAGIPAASGE